MDKLFRLFLEGLSIAVGGILGGFTGWGFRLKRKKAWISSIISASISFLILWYLIGRGTIPFNRSVFSYAAGISFILEVLEHKEIKPMILRGIKLKFKKY